jgi:thiol-disulfide isomerase/thioredoxin
MGSKKNISFSELRNGKAIIVDFWGKWCRPCIEAMPHLDSLKRMFKGQLEVLAINEGDSEKEVQKFIRNNPKLKDLSILFATDSASYLHKAFLETNVYPSEVWVDSSGIVRAKMSANGVTVEDVRELVSKGTVSGKYNITPLKVNESKGPFPTFDTGFIYRSVFEKAKLNVRPASYLLPDKYSRLKRVYFSRASIKDLYLFAAFSYTVPHSQKGRFILEVNDSIRYRKPKIGSEEWIRSGYKTFADWELENTYIYELILPQPVDEMQLLREYMLNDLNRFFNIKGTIELRKRPCFQIVNKTEASKQLTSTNRESKWAMDSIINGEVQSMITGFQNKTLDEIADKLSFYSRDMPFVMQPLIQQPLIWSVLFQC